MELSTGQFIIIQLAVILAFATGFYFGNRTIARQDYNKIKETIKELTENKPKIRILKKAEPQTEEQKTLEELKKQYEED